MLHWRRLIVLPALALTALAAPACAVDAAGDDPPEPAADPASDERLAEAEQDLEIVLVPEPACRAELQLTRPGIFANYTGPLNYTGCKGSNSPSPHVPRKISGLFSNPFDSNTYESDVHDSRFTASQYCEGSSLNPVCTPIEPSAIVDYTCDATRIYHCPCGVVSADIPGPYPASPPGKAYACRPRRIPPTIPTFTGSPVSPPAP